MLLGVCVAIVVDGVVDDGITFENYDDDDDADDVADDVGDGAADAAVFQRTV